MKYRVDKVIRDGRPLYYPEAGLWWFPLWFPIVADYNRSYLDEAVAWVVCKDYELGESGAHLDVDMLFGVFVFLVIPFFSIIVFLFMGGSK